MRRSTCEGMSLRRREASTYASPCSCGDLRRRRCGPYRLSVSARSALDSGCRPPCFASPGEASSGPQRHVREPTRASSRSDPAVRSPERSRGRSTSGYPGGGGGCSTPDRETYGAPRGPERCGCRGYPARGSHVWRVTDVCV